MKNRKQDVSQMQVEVWKMKDRVFVQTKKMNSKEFFGYIKNKCKGHNYNIPAAVLTHR